MYGQPIQTYAAGLVVLDRSELSRTRRRTIAAVWLDMIVDAAYESGRASRPGRADTAARLGIAEATVMRAWSELAYLGLAVRTTRGGEVSHRRLVAAGAVCVCGMPRKTAAKARHAARAEGKQACRWRERAEFNLATAADWEAMGVAAEDIEPILTDAEAAFTRYADRLAPNLSGPVPVVAPPSAVDPFAPDTGSDQAGDKNDATPTHALGLPRKRSASSLIIRRRTPSVGSPPRARKPRKPQRRRGRSLDRDAKTLATALIKRAQAGGLLPWLRTASVFMLASVLEARGWAQATPAEVERAAYDQLTRGVHTVPVTVAKPVAWLARWLPTQAPAAVEDPFDAPQLDVPIAPSATPAAAQLRRPQSVRPCSGGNCSGPTRAVICSAECPGECSGAHRAHGLPGSCPACG